MASITHFPAWQTVHLASGKRWDVVEIHDRLREWTRIEQERHRSRSEAIIDSQSVKSAAMVHQAVGFDASKKIKGTQANYNKDTLG